MLVSIIGGVFLCLSAYDAGMILIALKKGGELAHASSPYSANPSAAEKSILIVGDSTAVGTGADTPLDSVAGRMAREFPDVLIENHAADGAVLADVLQQLSAARHKAFDLVLIQVGGNDALRLHRLRTVREQIGAVLQDAKLRGDRVALISPGDLGAAPAIPWPLSYVFSNRARSMREIFAAAARIHGAHHVDFFVENGAADPFVKHPERYYARDGLHPSSAGYEVWYERLRTALPLDRWLTTNSMEADPAETVP